MNKALTYSCTAYQSPIALSKKHTICSYTNGIYTARLYAKSFDEDGNQTYEFIYMLSLSEDGSISKPKMYSTVSMDDVHYLNNALALYIWERFESKNHWITKYPEVKVRFQSNLLELIRFLMQYPMLQSYEWFYVRNFLLQIDESWCRRIVSLGSFSSFINYIADKHCVKSVLHRLYESFNQSIKINGEYDPEPDMIICRSFDDSNVVCTFLELPIKRVLFSDIPTQNAIQFFRWLQKRYSATAIVRSISQDVEYYGNFHIPIWVNTMRMVSDITESVPYAFKKYFQKGRMNSQSLHDELIRIHALASIEGITNKEYIYSSLEIQMEQQIGHLEFILVKNRFELFQWGEALHNCLFGFDQRIEKKKSYIVGVFIESTLKYTVEFDGKGILQAYGKYNKCIPDHDNDLIYRWAKSLKKSMPYVRGVDCDA